MNRIQPWFDEELDSAILQLEANRHHTELNGVNAFATGFEVADSQEEELCSIVTPQHYERNYAYPLIVWLHGPAADERQVTQIMPLVSLRNFAAVGPRGTSRVEGPPASFTWQQSPAQIERACRRVTSAVKQAQNWLNIAPGRIFLAGLGTGGTMALRLALARPEDFAGVLSIGGAFPRTHRPLARLQAARSLNVFLATSRDSVEYPPSQACDDLRLSHVAGLSICLRQYPCGDELATNMLADMNRWIMEQLSVSQPAETGSVIRGQGFEVEP